MSAYSHTFNLWGVLSQSKRIINAHSRHFLALSVSFLLPLSFSLIIYPTLQTALFHSDSNLFQPHPTQLSSSFFTSTDPYDPIRDLTQPDALLLLLFYTLFALLLSFLALATISYSTYHGFYGRPVKLVSSMKSVLYSFLPLVATLIVSRVIYAFIVLLFGFFAAIVIQFVQFLGFEVGYYLMGFAVFVGVVVLLVLLWMQVNWSLAYVIVVVESKWGYEPLRRSAYLVKGMRWVALSVWLFFGVLIGLLVGVCSSFLVTVGAASGGWTSFGVILQMVVSSGFSTLLMLQNIAASVVLYMYCKALHGELALEIADEFAREYVYLPFDDEKVPHVVCVVQG